MALLATLMVSSTEARKGDRPPKGNFAPDVTRNADSSEEVNGATHHARPTLVPGETKANRQNHHGNGRRN